MEPIKTDILNPPLFKVVHVRTPVVDSEGMIDYIYAHAKRTEDGWFEVTRRGTHKLDFSPEEWVYLGEGFGTVPVEHD